MAEFQCSVCSGIIEYKKRNKNIECPFCGTKQDTPGSIKQGFKRDKKLESYFVHGEDAVLSAKYQNEKKFHEKQGHGIAAENANDLYDKIRGKNVSLGFGNDNKKNGADSLANWDIMKEDTTEIVEEEEENSAPIRLNVNKFTVENLKASYRSIPDSMFAAVNGVNLNLKGDLSLDLETLANIEEFNHCFKKEKCKG